MREITIAWLRERKACASGIAAFEARFGESAPLTRKNLLAMPKYAEWLSAQLPDGEVLEEYDLACSEAYNLACSDEWAEYERVRAGARAEYKRVQSEARAECNRACAEALADALGLDR